MTTIAQLRLSGGSRLSWGVRAVSRPRVRVEPVVAGGIGLRVTGAEPGAVETALATDPTVTDHERIAAGEDRSLYDVGCGRVRRLFEAVADRGGTVLGATGGEAA